MADIAEMRRERIDQLIVEQEHLKDALRDIRWCAQSMKYAYPLSANAQIIIEKCDAALREDDETQANRE